MDEVKSKPIQGNQNYLLVKKQSPGVSPSPLATSITPIESPANIAIWTSLSVLAGLVIVVLTVCVVVYCLIKRKESLASCYKKTPTIRYQKVEMKDPDEEGKVKSSSRAPEKVARYTSKYTSSSPSIERGLEVSAGHLILSYIEDHLRNKNKLEEEWKGLEAYTPDDVEITEAVLQENYQKNRYPDALPYDHSAVKLDKEENETKSEYINASYIFDVNPKKPDYIVTQGPLVNTVSDFWQMVWEQNVAVIVMLTALSDKGMPQSYQYWPSVATKTYSSYKVQLVSEHLSNPDYTIRSFYLQNIKTGSSRTVTQLHYHSWTSHQVPATPRVLLEFRRKARKAMTDDYPMLIHCSDGMGRSGTFCLIDMSIRRIGRVAKEINLAATVEYLRDQRPNMVKTKEQYEFALTALVEETQSLLKGTS